MNQIERLRKPFVTDTMEVENSQENSQDNINNNNINNNNNKMEEEKSNSLSPLPRAVLSRIIQHFRKFFFENWKILRNFMFSGTFCGRTK